MFLPLIEMEEIKILSSIDPTEKENNQKKGTEPTVTEPNPNIDSKTEEFITSKFFIPSENKYRYLRLRIAPSKIKDAGMGVYAVDKIPKDAECPYKGVKKSMERGDVYYSWIIYEYDLITGNSITTKELFLLDASNKKTSNWTRYVNCGMRRRDNNMDSIQKFDKIYYFAKKNINPGQELFIDYGLGYRKTNLGMTGRY